MVAILLLPWALVQLSTQSVIVPEEGGDVYLFQWVCVSFYYALYASIVRETPSHLCNNLTQVTESWLSILVCLLATSIAQTIDYYTVSIATQHLDVHVVSRLGSMGSFLFSLFLASMLWTYTSLEEHGITAGVVIATVFYIIATPILTSSVSRSSQSTLIGYSASGLPLYTSQTTPTVSHLVRAGLSKMMESPDSRRIFYFLLLNLVSPVCPVKHDSQYHTTLIEIMPIHRGCVVSYFEPGSSH